MSSVALEALIEREEALVAALDAGDIDRIEQETRGLTGALTVAAAAGGWRESRDLADRVTRALRLAEAAGGRLNYLADDNRRRIDRLVGFSGQPRAVAYGRTGRFA